MNARALNCYRTVYVESSPPIEILDQLLGKAVSCLTEAKEHTHAGRIREKSSRVDRVLAIVAELTVALDHEAAPELTENLERLYGFVSTRVLESSLKGDVGGFEEAAKILKSIQESFREAKRMRGLP